MPELKALRIGNASGYWGDDPHALFRQLRYGPIDYVSLDFLAEVTMSILQKQRARNPELGYATDFVSQMREAMPLLKESKTRIISNAGGINPWGCAEELDRIARQINYRPRIAIVEGDDLMKRLDDLAARGIPLSNLETGEPFSPIRPHVLSANAYLGAQPVIRALDEEADIIITGRVTDTGITVAVPAREFDWALEDWDRLASAVVAGHILECGAQASGGNLTDWREIGSWQEMGYPIAEFSEDGTFHVTKHPGTGGLVTAKTVTEQLVYEMGDPRTYITPDVIADFSSIELSDEGDDRVRVSGVRGRPKPDQLKVSISYWDGYKAHGTLIVSRPDVAEKCRLVAEAFWNRLGIEFEETSTEFVGYNSCHGRLVPAFDPPEILLRLGVRDHDREKLEEFARQMTSLILSTAPGVAIVGARPRIQEVVAYWPCLIPAAEVKPTVSILNAGRSFQIPWQPSQAPAVSPSPVPSGPEPAPLAGPRVEVPLLRLCYARSGDKGDTSNIGLVARTPAIYDWLRREITAERVKAYFDGICRGDVERFEVPNLLALNFLLHQALGGGGTVSLRIDPQGKTLAEALLMMPVDIPESLLP